MPDKSPYQRASLQLSVAEYYRRLLIAILQDRDIVISGSTLLSVSAGDGLFLHFSSTGLTLHAERADTNWEAHVGTPSAIEPESWTVQSREHLVAAGQRAKVAVIDDKAAARIEKEQATERAVAQVESEGVEAARSGRVPWRTTARPAPQE
jgi:hypothetical protein